MLHLVCLVFCASVTLGQSLSIIRTGEREFRIDGSAPVDTRYALQASEDLVVWVDLNDAVQGRVEYSLKDVGARPRFFRLVRWVPLSPASLVLLGDSSVADFVMNEGRYCGWGEGVPTLAKPELQVINLAVPGYSTRRYLGSDEERRLQMVGPDYVLVQFGTMDVVHYGLPELCYTTPEEFKDNLIHIALGVRSVGGVPILITPPVLELFDAQGRVLPWIPDRCAIIREVAEELSTPLVDLNQLSMDLVNNLGQTGCAYIFSGLANDSIHYSFAGAHVIAELVVEALPGSLQSYFAPVEGEPSKP